MTKQADPRLMPDEARKALMDVLRGYDTCCGEWCNAGNPDPSEYGDTWAEWTRAVDAAVRAYVIAEIEAAIDDEDGDAFTYMHWDTEMPPTTA